MLRLLGKLRTVFCTRAKGYLVYYEMNETIERIFAPGPGPERQGPKSGGIFYLHKIQKLVLIGPATARTVRTVRSVRFRSLRMGSRSGKAAQTTRSTRSCRLTLSFPFVRLFISLCCLFSFLSLHFHLGVCSPQVCVPVPRL